jgi:teichuronic acid exporter
MQNLRSRTVKALLWNLSGTGGKLAFQLLIQICLARLLSPKDFGLMAMLMVLTSVGLVFVEGGFGIALIHHKNASREDESSVFFCNLGLASLAYGVLWLLAPWVAVFYNQATLEPLLRFSALGMVLGAFGVVQNSVLSRSLNFKTLSIVDLGTSVLAGSVAIWLAWSGYGVWSLAWQFVITATIRSLLLWFMSPWRPLFTFRYDAIRRMGAYGSRLVTSNLISALFENLNQLLIGKFYTAGDLGFYSRAKMMQSIPVNTFSHALNGVLLPAFVHLNDQPEEFRKGYRRAIRCSAAVAVPMMAIFGLLAKPIFLLLLSAKWLPAVPYFQIFCIAGILYPLHIINLNTLLALGKPDLYLKLEVIKKLVSLCGAAIALPFGVMAFAQATVALSIVALVINTHYTRKLVDYGLLAQLRDILPFLISAAAALPLAWTALPLAGDNLFLQITLGGTIAAAVYLAISWLLARDTYQFILRSARLS